MDTFRPVLFLALACLSSLFLFSSSAGPGFSHQRFPALHRFEAKQSPNPHGKLYETRYFAQTLDHFNYNPQSYATFPQRYLVNDSHWGGKGAPIFAYTGNEGNVELFANNTGLMFEIAPHFRALLVFIEHRYYGESVPFGGKDVAYSNSSTVGYLSTTQALADYATLIVDLKKNLTSEESPVVVFGGSYGGMLAAWFRLKYPHVAVGALASSAPILQFDDIASPYTFNNIVTKDFRSVSENCYKVIKNSWKEIEETANQRGAGAEKLEKAFKLCKGQGAGAGDLDYWIRTALIYTAMTDYPTASNFLAPLPANPVKQMCEAIDNPIAGNDTFAKLYGAMNIYYNYTGSTTCFNLTESDPFGMDLLWGWQSCTEMIMPQGANTEESIFPASTYKESDEAFSCAVNYGVLQRPHWITTEFGGHDIKRVLKRFGSNIIFFNGLRDPWSGGGVLKSLSKSLIAIVAHQGAHHVDLRFSTKEDPLWLRNVRRREVRIIARWLQQYYIDAKTT